MNKIQNLLIATATIGIGAFAALPLYAADEYFNTPRSSTSPTSSERAQHGEPAGDSGPYGRARADTPPVRPGTVPPTSSERAQQGAPAGDSGIYGRGSVGATTQTDKESRTLEQDAATRQQFGAPAGDSGPMGKSSAIGEQQPGRQNVKPGSGLGPTPSGTQ